MQADAATRLLLIEDEVRLCRLVKEYLEGMGYAVAMEHSGPAGLAAALREPFDAIVLDVMLPGLDGFEVLRRIRMHSTTPVLMLTGRGEEADRIVGLEMGADDYLPKTFSTRELLARLRAVLRRSMIAQAQTADRRAAPVAVGELVVDPGPHLATLNGRSLPLTRQEFDLLLSLARASGRVKTRESLLLEVADRDFEGFDRSIDVHISSLRKKLGDDAKGARWIETIRGVGYLLERPQTNDAGAQDPPARLAERRAAGRGGADLRAGAVPDGSGVAPDGAGAGPGARHRRLLRALTSTRHPQRAGTTCSTCTDSATARTSTWPAGAARRSRDRRRLCPSGCETRCAGCCRRPAPRRPPRSDEPPPRPPLPRESVFLWVQERPTAY